MYQLLLNLLSQASSLIGRIGSAGVSKLNSIIYWAYYQGSVALQWVANNFWKIIDWISRGVAIEQIIETIMKYL